MRLRLLSIGLVLVWGLALVGCPHPAPCAGKPAALYHDSTMTNVNPANVFYKEIPNWNTNPQLDPESPQIMQHFQEVIASLGGRQPFWDNVWSTPTFYGDASVPLVNVRLWESYAIGDWFIQQRIPCWAETNDNNTDSTIDYIDLVSGCEGNVWQYNLDPQNLNTWPCGATGGAWPIDFDGTGRAQAGVTGVQKSFSAGMGMGVFPDELTDINNPINHGFSFSYPWEHNKPVAYDPAYKADGSGTCQYDMCQGFRLQLNPSYAYGPERKTWERKYMDALKKYGAYDVDSGGNLKWRSLPSKLSSVNNPFAGIFPDEVSLETSAGWDARFPLDQFRLIQRGALVTAEPVFQETYCGTYTEYNRTISPAPAAPTLSSISPSTAAAGTYVTLNGTNMTGTYRVYFGPDTNCTWNPTVLSSTQVRCLVPAGSGTVAVKVKTGGGFSGTQSFTYSGGGGSAPTLSTITPNSGTTAGGTACTLAGSNMTGTASVSFSGTAATGVVVDGAAQVRCTSPARSAGACTVTATNSYGTSNGLVYTYTATPTLTTLTPNTGSDAGGTSVTLTGTNLTGTTGVSFGGTAATGIVNDSSTQVRCTSPAKTAGTYSVTATTSGGTSNGVNYTYTSAPPSYTATLYSPHDACVKSTSTNTNYGTTNMLVSKNGSVENQTYIKFDLNSISGTTITSATLRLKSANTAATAAEQIYSCATDTWDEMTLKWGNKPAVGTQQASFTAPVTGSWVDINVTSYINANFNGDKLVTMIILDNASLNKMAQFYSDETGAATSSRPQLVVISN